MVQTKSISKDVWSEIIRSSVHFLEILRSNSDPQRWKYTLNSVKYTQIQNTEKVQVHDLMFVMSSSKM